MSHRLDGAYADRPAQQADRYESLLASQDRVAVEQEAASNRGCMTFTEH
ncbi:MAG TPA: hypothetical protein VGE28_04995 [Pseudomonas sp.]